MTTSRYDLTSTLRLTAADGRQVAYLRRRFIPPPASYVVQAHEQIGPGDRVDLVADRVLNDPELSWVLADANAARLPSDLDRPGLVIVVPSWQVTGGGHAV